MGLPFPCNSSQYYMPNAENMQFLMDECTSWENVIYSSFIKWKTTRITTQIASKAQRRDMRNSLEDGARGSHFQQSELQGISSISCTGPAWDARRLAILAQSSHTVLCGTVSAIALFPNNILLTYYSNKKWGICVFCCSCEWLNCMSSVTSLKQTEGRLQVLKSEFSIPEVVL